MGTIAQSTITNTVTVAQINAVAVVAVAVAASVAVVSVVKIPAYQWAPNHTNAQTRWQREDLHTRNINNPDLLKIPTTNRAKVREAGNLREVTTTTTTNATINQITVTRRRFVTLCFYPLK